MLDKTETKVVLPMWCWKGAQSKSDLMCNAKKYINPKRYPGYTILYIEDNYAICGREI